MNVGGERTRAPQALPTARLKPPFSAVAKGVPSLCMGSQLSQCGQGKDTWLKKEKTENQSKPPRGLWGLSRGPL